MKIDLNESRSRNTSTNPPPRFNSNFFSHRNWKGNSSSFRTNLFSAFIAGPFNFVARKIRMEFYTELKSRLQIFETSQIFICEKNDSLVDWIDCHPHWSGKMMNDLLLCRAYRTYSWTEKNREEKLFQTTWLQILCVHRNEAIRVCLSTSTILF